MRERFIHTTRFRMRPRLLLLVLLALAGCDAAPAQTPYRYDSGGPLMPEQAAYDVVFYDLALAVSPADSTIAGALTVTARITSPAPHLVLDLDPALAVSAASDAETGEPLAFERRGGKLWVAFPYTKQPGETTAVTVAYGGRPRIAPRPPWDGGFTWARTPSGAPWITTTVQQEGADLWWPVKDHVSDEPDSMALHVTVPEPLVVASNGRLRAVEPHGDGTRTYHWFISTPINAYDVALNIAPYRTIEDTFTSVAGDVFPVVFYVLPEDYEKGLKFFPEILDHLRFFEAVVGPYPFRADKYGVAQTPHLGMEHQTIIAYGANFDNGAMTGGRDWGFDALHHHELSHEWWGNLVTNVSWEDMWLHEGFGSYMQPLYLERTQGADAYRAYLEAERPGIANRRAVAPRKTLSAKQVYGGDIYVKGAWILHTLRYLLGDEAFFTSLRRMAYPDPALEAVTDGSACRFAVTDDFVHLAEAVSGRDLGWFFDVYVRQPALPALTVRREGERVALQWDVPGGLPFPMPVDVRVGAETRRVEMPDGAAVITAPAESEVVVDPENRILRRGNR